MTAMEQVMIVLSSGTGVSSSAIMGANMVQARAAVLQIPKTAPRYRLGKYTSVLMYSIANPAQIPNFARSIIPGTILMSSFFSAIQRKAAAPTASMFIRRIEFRGPRNLTMRPDSKVDIDSERDATIEFLYTLPGMYFM